MRPALSLTLSTQIEAARSLQRETLIEMLKPENEAALYDFSCKPQALPFYYGAIISEADAKRCTFIEPNPSFEALVTQILCRENMVHRPLMLSQQDMVMSLLRRMQPENVRKILAAPGVRDDLSRVVSRQRLKDLERQVGYDATRSLAAASGLRKAAPPVLAGAS